MLFVVVTTSFTFDFITSLKSQMENKEIIDSADSCNAMLIEDVLKSQNNDLYCPDLSDMRDDNYEFWDFLNSKKDVSPKVEENTEGILQNKFWDFLGPSVNEVKNAALFKNCKQTEFAVASNNDPNIYEKIKSKENTLPNHSNVAARKTKNCSKSHSSETKLSSSDDEFWDFLSCHSPVITFEEAFRNYNPILPDKDGENSSLFPANEESSFVSSSEFFESGIFSSSSQSCVTSENYPQTIQKCRRNNFEMKGNTRQNFSLENNSELNERISVPYFTNCNDARNFTKQDYHIDEKDVEWLDSLSTKYKANETTEINQKMHGNNNSSFSSVYDNLMQPNVEFQKNMYSNTDPADDTNQKRNIQKTITSDSTSNTFKQIFLQSSTSSGCSTSSGSSANANLAWMTSVFSGTNIPDTLVENINSNTINSSDSQIQETRKFTQLINKKQCKRSRNTSNRLNVVKRTLDVTCDSASNTARKSNSNTQEIQKKLQRSELTVESSNTAPTQRINFIPTANSTIAYNTAAVPSTISNTVANNSNIAPLYLILPPNSESSLKNPNYSHYFLILNNNAQPNQSNLIPSTGVASNANSSTNTQTQKDTLSFSDNNTKNVNQSNILLHQNALQFKQINLGQSSTSTTATNSVNSSVKYHVIPQLILQPNSVVGNSNQRDICFLKPISVASNVMNTSVSMNQSVSASKVHDSTANSISTSSSQSSYNSEPSASSKADTKIKTLQAKTKQVPPKPIKNISLGKDKYAIQQISIPVKMGDSNKEQNECIDLHKTNEDYPGGKTISEIKLTENLTPNSKELQINGASNSQVIFSIPPDITNSIKPNHINNINFVPITMNTDSKIKQPTYHILKNTNTVVSNQTPLSVNTQPINVNVFPISETLEMNKNIHSRNTVKLVDIIDNQSTPDCNSEVQNDCVQIKMGNAQNKSLATLQELFPPPISMVPVCIIPPTQTINQVNTSKILILKGPGQQNIFQHRMQINPIPTRLRPNLKKANMKFKKMGRRKTVRELLQERKQTLSKQTNNKIRREIRVLRPILKLPINTFCQSTTTPTITNVSKLNEASSSTNSTTSTSKRPNILLLPSSSKLAEKNSLEDYLQSVFRNEQEASCSEEFSGIESIEGGVSPYLSSTLNRKDYRPRHYDMSQLNIGYFRVDDDIDSCGRFRSKFKVIFSKRQFLYDFPVSRCNQFGLKSTAVWEQMARIAVSFKSVVSMNLSERTVQISINTPPAITLGRLKARSGVIANATIYDTPVESSSSWGSMIRSTFHHKIVLRKRQAGKLRSFLCHFDDRFITLTSLGVCDNGISNASELSIFEGELSPTTLKKSFSKNKKSGIRRLSRWDSPASDDLKAFGEEELLLPNQMCSCRISCRSVRCSCVKVAKSCSSICDCINCDNPLNILESIGLDLNFSLSDCCLFQNIYQIPRLISFLKKEVKLTCCNTFAHVQDCIPGTVLCPNIDCNVQVEFSWCRKMVCYPERNPRNHCSFCGQCCFSNGRHCMTCNRCYVVSSKSPGCPTCKEKTPFNSFHEYDKNCHIDQADRRSEGKPNQKPEIIILDSYSLAKTSDTTENPNEVSNMHDSPNIITID